MYQGTIGRLLNHSESCQVQRVASLLTEALSEVPRPSKQPCSFSFRRWRRVYRGRYDCRVAPSKGGTCPTTTENTPGPVREKRMTRCLARSPSTRKKSLTPKRLISVSRSS